MKKLLRVLGRLFLALLFLAAAALVTLGLAALAGPDPSARRSGPRRVGGLRRGRVLLPGEVDWPVLAEQGVDFAFIKATEGSLLQDRRFAANWAGSAAAGVRAGAYHFLSYDSPGETQADNFIAAVPVTEGPCPRWWISSSTGNIWTRRRRKSGCGPFWTPCWSGWRPTTASSPSST
ncbi:MAG: GH25 family lysozyme [Flavonifractor plautii]